MKELLKKYYFFILILLLFFIIARVIYSFSARVSYEESIERVSELKTNSLKNILIMWHQNILEKLITSEIFIQNRYETPQEVLDVLKTLDRADRNIADIHFYSKTGYAVFTKESTLDLNYDFHLESELNSMRNRGKKVKIYSELDEKLGFISVTNDFRISDLYGNDIGILRLMSPIRIFDSFVGFDSDNSSIYYIITNSEGQIIYHSYMLQIKNIEQIYRESAFRFNSRRLAEKIDANSRNFMQTRVFNKQGYLSYELIPENDWYIFTFIGKDFFQESFRSNLLSYLMIFVFPTILILVFIIVQKKWVILPITRLEKAINQVSIKENPSLRLPVKKRDVLFKLRLSINMLLDRIEYYIADIVKLERIRSAVFKISESVHDNIKMKDLYKLIHSIVSEVMDANNFYIALYDKERDLISFPYYVDEFDDTPENYRPGKGLTELVLRKGKPLLTKPEIFDSLRENGEIEVVGTLSPNWLGVPLIVGNETIGVMAVQSYTEVNKYGEDEKDILIFMAEQAAIAISTSKAKAQLEATKIRFESLFQESPISLWEQDFSEIKAYLDILKVQGVTDFDDYFIKNPVVLGECLSRLKIIDVNKQTLNLFNCENKIELESNLNFIFRTESIDFFKQELKSIFYRKNYHEGESVNYKISGEKINLMVKWIVVPGYESTLERVIVAMSDISEVKKVNEELNKSLKQTIEASIKLRKTQQELIKSEQKNAIYAMAVTANHELNQPLMIIQGNIDMLRLKVKKPESDKYFQNIYSALDRMERILYKLKKIENPKFEEYITDTLMIEIDHT